APAVRAPGARRRGPLRRRGHPGLGDVSRGRHRPRGRPRRERSGGPVVATDTAKSGGTWTVVRRFLLDNGALTALALLVVVMSLLSGDFLTAQNLLNVGVQAAVIAVLAFGVTFVIISGGIDLSVGSVAALSATMLALLATVEGVP